MTGVRDKWLTGGRGFIIVYDRVDRVIKGWLALVTTGIADIDDRIIPWTPLLSP